MRPRRGGRTAALLFRAATHLIQPRYADCYLQDLHPVHAPPACNAEILRRPAPPAYSEAVNGFRGC
ncbi:hypothetical protein EMIT0P294_11238 [Pseudomonas sp. IT-P294]